MPNVLLIDDDPVIHRLIDGSLQMLGCELISAYNGVDGERLALEKNPELILLDIMMPLQDGYVTCEHLRQKGFGGAITMMSALNETTGTKKSMKYGANAYLLKPFDRYVLALHLEYATGGMKYHTMAEWMTTRP